MSVEYVGCWVGGSCSLYFHESCRIKRTIPPHAPYCPPVQSTLMAVSCSTPYWLYIIPTFLSLGFLFVFPDALSRLSHWDYKETILRAEQRWTHDLASLKEGGRWLGCSESIQWLFNLKQRSWVVKRLLHIWLLCTEVKWMQALYILTVQSAYSSSIVYSPISPILNPCRVLKMA